MQLVWFVTGMTCLCSWDVDPMVTKQTSHSLTTRALTSPKSISGGGLPLMAYVLAERVPSLFLLLHAMLLFCHDKLPAPVGRLACHSGSNRACRPGSGVPHAGAEPGDSAKFAH